MARILYNTTLGSVVLLPNKLQQTYTGVISQVFPLAANIGVLEDFCDSYLNLKQDKNPPFWFKPAAPFVLMQVVDYGDMAEANAIGWFSQHELAFGIPVEWHVRDKDGWHFKDIAMHYPFIYVDNPLSIAGGREVYGWAKSPVKFKDYPVDLDPADRRTSLRVNLDIKGTDLGPVWGLPRDAEEVEFLSIYQRPRIGTGLTGLGDLFTAWPRAMANSLTAFYSIFRVAALPTTYWTRDLQALQQLLFRWYGFMMPMGPPYRREPGHHTKGPGQGYDGRRRGSSLPQTQLITFKQVRDTDFSSASAHTIVNNACFQAIIGSTMTIDRVGDFGLLYDLTSGDTSGGIEISLLQSAEAPILNTLGLITASTTGVGENTRATLRPIAPFWTKMDLDYGTADYQAWRTTVSDWTTDDEVSATVPAQQIEFVRPGSGTGEDIGGQFDFKDIVCQIFPIPAHQKALQTLIDHYFDTAGKITFSVPKVPTLDPKHDAYVFLVAADFHDLSAFTNQKTNYKDKEVFFAVMVNFTAPSNGNTMTALVPLYSFVGAQWNASTTSDVYGRLALKSEFSRGSVVFPTYPTQKPEFQEIETVTSLFLPEVKPGQKAAQLPFIEFWWLAEQMTIRTVPPDHQKPQDVDLRSGDTESDRQTATETPKEQKATTGPGTLPVPIVLSFFGLGLKQVRNSKDLTFADYQAIASLQHKLTVKSAMRGPTDMKVRISSYPSLDIYKILNLDCGTPIYPLDKNGKQIAGSSPYAYEITFPDPSALVPIPRTFVLESSMITDAGEDLCVRVSGQPWTVKATFPSHPLI